MTAEKLLEFIDDHFIKFGRRPESIQLTNEECAELAASAQFIGPHNGTDLRFSFAGIPIRVLFDFPDEERIQ